MPYYVFRMSDGTTEDIFMSVSEMLGCKTGPDSFLLPDGRVAYRDYVAEHATRGAQNVSVEHISEAYGVNSPEELAECRANDKRYFGSEAPDDYTPDGRAVWRGDIQTVMQRKKRYGRKQGLVDRDSYS